MRRRLEWAQALVDGLCAQSPGDKAHDLARVHVVAKLGVALHRLGRAADAEASYRRAIDLAGDLIRRFPAANRPRIGRSIAREALAKLRFEQGDRAGARAALDEAAADLLALSGDVRMPPPPPIASRIWPNSTGGSAIRGGAGRSPRRSGPTRAASRRPAREDTAPARRAGADAGPDPAGDRSPAPRPPRYSG